MRKFALSRRLVVAAVGVLVVGLTPGTAAGRPRRGSTS
jgi:hypothetical protein